MKLAACRVGHFGDQCRVGQNVVQGETVERIIAEALKPQTLQRIAQAVPRVERGDGKPQRGWAFDQGAIRVRVSRRTQQCRSVVHDGCARIDCDQWSSTCAVRLAMSGWRDKIVEAPPATDRSSFTLTRGRVGALSAINIGCGVSARLSLTSRRAGRRAHRARPRQDRPADTACAKPSNPRAADRRRGPVPRRILMSGAP